MIAASRQLLERRVPQYLALYLGIAWGVVQFIDFIAQRYALSPHLTDVALLGFALLLPSDRVKALEHLRRAAQVWKDADATEALAADAQARLKQLDDAS
jgi:hypothetical protein